jgi:hypothetical protein
MPQRIPQPESTASGTIGMREKAEKLETFYDRMIQAAAKSDCIGSGMGPLDSFLLGLLEGLHTLARAFILNEISVDDVTVITSGRDSSHGTGRSCA